MGVKVVLTDFAKSADSVGGIGDAMDETTDSTKKAAKALKDYTMGFDELNIIDPTQGSSGSGSGASAGNILGDVDLSGYDMFKNYVGTSIDEMKQKIVEEILDCSTRIVRIFEKEIKRLEKLQDEQLSYLEKSAVIEKNVAEDGGISYNNLKW